MHINKIVCDGCNKELRFRSSDNLFKLILNQKLLEQNQHLPHLGLDQDNLLDHNMDFCNKECLKQWINKEDKE